MSQIFSPSNKTNAKLLSPAARLPVSGIPRADPAGRIQHKQHWTSSYAAKRIHLIGMGGCGMSSLGGVLLRCGAIVSGSDLVEFKASARLEEMGAVVRFGHAPINVPSDCNLVVYSAAIGEDNIELREARRRGVKCLKYAEMLGEVMRLRTGIAIAGTHGKSTTTALLTYILRIARADPTFVVGAGVRQLGGSSGVGDGSFFVVEACEYDRSFLHLAPAYAAILNIEEDHLDCFDGIDAIARAFREFAALVPPDGLIVANAEDRVVARAVADAKAPIETFGESPDASWRAINVQHDRGCYRFDVVHQGKPLLHANLANLPGRHQVSNALVATALATRAGIEPAAIAQALSQFAGAERRMTHRGDVGGITLIDDYAHHPTEIQVTSVRCVNTIRAVGCGLFFSLTNTPARGSCSTTSPAVLPWPIICSCPTSTSSAILNPCATPFVATILSSACVPAVAMPCIFPGLSRSWTTSSSVPPRVIWSSPWARATYGRSQMNLFDDLPEGVCRRNVPLAPLTWFKLGGAAESFVEPQTQQQLAEIVRRCGETNTPIRVLGLGANVLVPDEGVGGVVLRLSAEPFTKMVFDGERALVGGGLDLTRLVRSAVRSGLAGLEPLAGIPGTVGGGICMNCGGRFGEIASALSHVDVIGVDGRIRRRSVRDLRFGYRTCHLDGDYVVGAAFQLRRTDPAKLRRRFEDIWAYKQQTQPTLGVQSVGCIFRNPSGRSAGQLIDRAGLKGFRIGSASISPRHANFALADRGGRAGDVRRLITTVADRVAEHCGVRLEPEVKIW